MRIKELLGVPVLDSKANEIGKVDDIDFDSENGSFDTMIINLDKGFFSKESVEIDFDEIDTIGDYVILKSEIVTIEKPDVEIE